MDTKDALPPETFMRLRIRFLAEICGNKQISPLSKHKGSGFMLSGWKCASGELRDFRASQSLRFRLRACCVLFLTLHQVFRGQSDRRRVWRTPRAPELKDRDEKIDPRTHQAKTMGGKFPKIASASERKRTAAEREQFKCDAGLMIFARRRALP